MCRIVPGNLIPGAELKVHGIASFAVPLSSPFKSGSTKDFNQPGIHVPGGPLRIGLRIEIDRDAPTVSGEFASGALGTKSETPAEAYNLRLKPVFPYAGEDRGINASHQAVAHHLSDDAGRVPCEAHGEG